MAGSASNWFRPSSGPLKGQAVYLNKKARSGLSRQDVLTGLNTGTPDALQMVAQSPQPTAAARSRADMHATGARDVVRAKRALGNTEYQEYRKPDLPQDHPNRQNQSNLKKLFRKRNQAKMRLFAERRRGNPDAAEKLEGDIRILSYGIRSVTRKLLGPADQAAWDELINQENRGLNRMQNNQVQKPAGLPDQSDGNSYMLRTYSNEIYPYQSKAMDRYVLHSYQVNNGLRTGNLEKSPPMDGVSVARSNSIFRRRRNVRPDVEALDSLVQKVPQGAEISMYRGLDARILGDVKPGMLLRDAGFMSMGFRKDAAQTYADSGLESIDGDAPVDQSRVPAILRVNLREGTRVVPTLMEHPQGRAGEIMGQNEMLLDRGSTLRVSSVTEEDGYLMIDTEIVDQRG